MEETEIVQEEVLPEEEDTDMLHAGAERRRKEGRADDSAAMQAAVCVILAISFILLNMTYPDTAGELISRLRQLSQDPGEIISNPIDLLLSWINSL